MDVSRIRPLRVVIWVAATLVALTIVIAATTQTVWFKDYLRSYIVRTANQQLNGTLSIGTLGGNLLSGIELRQVAVSISGRTVIAIDEVRASYDLAALVRSGMVVDVVSVIRPAVAVLRDGQGWDLGRLVKTGSDSSAARHRTLLIRQLIMTDGSLSIASPGTPPTRLERIDAALSVQYAPDRYALTLARLSFLSSDTAIAVHQATGGITLDQRDAHFTQLDIQTQESRVRADGDVKRLGDVPVFQVTVRADPLSLPELRRLVPAIGSTTLRPRIDLRLSGPLDRVAADLNLTSSSGNVRAEGVAGSHPAGWSFLGHVSARHLDLAAFVDNPVAHSDIAANLTLDAHAASPFDLKTVRVTAVFDAPRLRVRDYLLEQFTGRARIAGPLVQINARTRAFDADVVAAGTVAIPRTAADAVEFSLHGRATGVDLSRVPASLRVPAADTDLTGDYQVTGAVGGRDSPHISGETTLDNSMVAGATIARGSAVRFRAGRGDLEYQAHVRVADVDLAEIGKQFHVGSLDAGRFRSRLAGDFIVNVRHADLETMTLEANGTLAESSLFAGRVPNVSFDTVIRDNTLKVTANGNVEGIDLAVVTGRAELAGQVTGSVETNLTFARVSRGVALDSVDGDALIELAPSSMGRFTLDRASIAGDYHNAVVDVQRLDIDGAGAHAMGNGTLALNETDESGFWIHADATSLEQIGLWVRQPLAGIATVDATVSGNRRQFNATGSLMVDGAKYEQYGALTAASAFSATVENLDWAHTSLTADSRGTFVELPGLHVNELSAKTTYLDKRVVFDLTAAQPRRTLVAAGSVEFRPEDREVRLQRLRFETQGLTWQTQAGRESVITYGHDTVGIKDLELVNGDQKIAAAGLFGRADEKLTVAFTGVDMGVIDAWLLRQPQLAGRFNARADVSGGMDSPKVDAQFSVVSGRFRDVPYESLDGWIATSGTGAELNVTLQQNASQWITAQGHAPLAAFKAEKQPGDHYDLHVESSAVDLGIVQGATPILSGVKGTLQAQVDVTGASEAPRLAGTVTLQNGAFTLETTGVSYTGLDGRIDLLPDRIHIDDLHVLDNQSQQLSVSGDLRVTGLQVGDFNLYVSGIDFKVLDNKMGNLRLNSDLRLTGTFAQPRLEGELDVSTGTLNLDPILATLGGGAYPTEPLDASDGTASQRESDEDTRSTGRRIALAIRLVIPDDLVVKARDLKALGTTFGLGLGSVNVTLGGDLNISASPGRPTTLVGAVNTIRGFYDFQGRRFTIVRDGSVRFQGDAIDRLDPALDVRAERVIQAVTARVDVRGRLRRPTVELTSTPPLDKSDILALIIFNQPLSALGDTQQASLTERAAAMAAGAATRQLTNAIANSLNLNQFEINIAPDSGAAAELVVGQQLGRNVYVRVRQGVGDHSQTNLILEYEFAKWLRLQTNFLEGADPQQQLFQRVQSTGLDLVFSFTFK